MLRTLAVRKISKERSIRNYRLGPFLSTYFLFSFLRMPKNAETILKTYFCFYHQLQGLAFFLDNVGTDSTDFHLNCSSYQITFLLESISNHVKELVKCLMC